jgi:Tol biopolymer transport system component
MGEVYRARDPRLGRDVAIKVLPAAYSLDPDRLHRFELEARAAAALNHPNILAVFDIGQHDGAPYIVSELLEGETLRGRLQGTPSRPLPVRVAVDYAQQIARGLAAAHEKGIVHRDLKPENIFVTSDERVKILDFGLAKLADAPPAATATRTSATPGTEPGVVLGTIGYMSPEQVRAQPVDHRADIFAFGAILFEMLSGRRAFRGDSHADVLVAIVSEATPSVPGAAASAPAGLSRIVERCLEKNPSARFQSTHDLRFALEGVASQSDATVTAGSGAAPPARAFPWTTLAAVVAAATLAVIVALMLLYRRAPDQARPVVRFGVVPPGSVAFSANSSFIRLSPGGDRIAIVALNTAGTPLIWVRSLDSLDAKPLEGTDGARQPFWSADGRSIGFFSPGGQIKRVPVDGGPTQTVTTGAISTGTGATWNQGGVILFSSLAGPIRRIAAAGGGESSVETALDSTRQEDVHSFPEFLPDGRRFLYYAHTTNAARDGIYVKTLDASDARFLVRASSNAVYAAPGFLLYARDGTLLAQPFDADRATTTGEPVPLAEHVDQSPESGLAAFTVSNTGVLAYSSSPSASVSRLLWFDRGGRQLSQLGEPRNYRNPRISPDGARLAVELVDNAGNRDVWLMDMARGVPVRFTFDPGRDASPVWSPDGKQIAWQGNSAVYLKASSGEGREERLRGEAWIPDDWSRDGGALLYHPSPPLQVWLRPLAAGAAPERPVIEGRGITTHARVSPDGRWVAFASADSGRFEIYVQNFPNPAGRWQVSASGGLQPKWRQDGKELFYLAADGRMMAAPVALGALVEIGQPQPLFQTRIEVSTGITWHQYDVAPDGQRFLVNTPEIVTSPATVVLNWPALVKR